MRRRYFKETYEGSEWGKESHICHNSDYHVLLEVEPPRVETPCVTEGSELPGREDRLQELTSGKCKQLRDVG